MSFMVAGMLALGVLKLGTDTLDLVLVGARP
jgi:hypothetical protein